LYPLSIGWREPSAVGGRYWRGNERRDAEDKHAVVWVSEMHKIGVDDEWTYEGACTEGAAEDEGVSM
jgi:hypothetical protein